MIVPLMTGERWGGRVGQAKTVALATLVCAATMVMGVGLSSVSGSVAGAAAPAVVTAPHATTPSDETNSAYAIVDAAGGVLTYGQAGYHGDTLGLSLAKPIVGAAPDPTGGYWLVASDGGIFSFGGALFHGSTGGTPLNKPIVGMAPTPDGGGYWLVASDGGIFAYGDAQFWGSTGNLHLNKPIVGMAATPDGLGYWLVASDGGIFAFGDAQFWGSTGNISLNKPIVGMAATSNGDGYWLVASDGGIFSFGNANFYGSGGALPLNSPIVSMAATPDGGGYWLVGADAGVFSFGDAQFSGSAQSPLHPPLFPAPFSAAIPPVVTIMPDAPGPQATHQGGLRVAFVGDSLGFYEGEYTLNSNPGYQVDDGAAPGCGFTNGADFHPWSNPSAVFTDPGACALWAQQLQWVDARFHPDVSVIQSGYWEAQDRLFNGQYVTLTNAAFAASIQANLNEAVNLMHADGSAVILETAPYFSDGTPNNLVDIYNGIVAAVAQANSSFVTLLDLHALLDPNGAYAPVIDGVTVRTPDGVHITQAGTEQVITPQINAAVASVSATVYNGDA
jgi:hypothetical protein